MSFYFNTRRIMDIMERSAELSYRKLDNMKLKTDCFNYLAKVYQQHSSEPLTNLDFANIEDITYRFCLPYFGEDFNNDRVVLTRNYLQCLKKETITLHELLQTFSSNYLD